jgi:hypothetical protein
MADLYATAIEGTTVGANSRKLLGDGASGVGPYTSFGTPKLQAIKVVSATINFTTTPTITNSNLAKAVFALQGLAEIYYVGIPTASDAMNVYKALKAKFDDRLKPHRRAYYTSMVVKYS